MKVKEIIKQVCEFVGEVELLAKLEQPSAQFTLSEQRKLDTMQNCFNLVNQEIASDHLPFLTKENVDAQGVLAFSSLSKPVIHIYEIKNRFGLNMKFKTISDHVEFEGRAKSVLYSYLPSDLTLESEVTFMRGLSSRVYAYGIASEFLLVYGIGSDAEIWEEKFKEALFSLSQKRGEHVMPKRSWF